MSKRQFTTKGMWQALGPGGEGSELRVLVQIDCDFTPNQSKCLALMWADQKATWSTTECGERDHDWVVSPVILLSLSINSGQTYRNGYFYFFYDQKYIHCRKQKSKICCYTVKKSLIYGKIPLGVVARTLLYKCGKIHRTRLLFKKNHVAEHEQLVYNCPSQEASGKTHSIATFCLPELKYEFIKLSCWVLL